VDNPLLKSAAVAAGFERAGVALPPRPIQGPITGDTSDAAEAARERAMRDIADKVASAMAPLIEKDLVSVRRFRYWVEIEIKTNILFASGSALLDDKALPALQHVAGILKGQPNRIQVEGFTDDRPVRNLVYPSNWELSAARSMSVVHMFVREGVQPARLSAVGFGEYRPVAPNDTEEGRARNRRVVLVVFSDENNVERARDLQGTAAAVPDKKTDAPPAEAAAPDAPPDSASSRETPAAAESRGG
jgi:chemotaxis protein MotB